jgi:hypothetical protein
MARRRPRLAVGLLTLAVALALAPAPGAVAASRLTCRSGHTVYKKGQTRLFYVTRRGKGGPYDDFRICSSHVRRPAHVLFADAPFGTKLTGFRVFGSRLGYEIDEDGAIEISQSVGWADLRTGRARDRYVDTDKLGAASVSGFGVAEDGSLALLLETSDEQEQLIAYAPAGAKRIGEPRVIAHVPGHDVVPDSLAVAGGTVTWTTAAGQQGSAPIGE